MSRSLSTVILLVIGLVTAWLGQGLSGPPAPEGTPDRLLLPLQVQAAHDGERIHLRLRWPAPDRHRYHDVLRFDGERWEVIGAGDPDDLFGEERISMLLDDGSVPDFARYGGYLLIGEGTRFMPGAAPEEAVENHPVLGGELGLSDIRKHLPDTRLGGWAYLRPAEQRRAQQQAGYFLDLWHWRGDRGGPVATADDLHVAEHRHADQGRASYTTNWDDTRDQPRYMFDPDRHQRAALRWETLREHGVRWDEGPWLTPDSAVPFDADHDWQPGDVLPRRVLREPDGSRADIHTRSRWADGWREVEFIRALDTGNPEEDKALKPGGLYTAAFAVHHLGATGRHHHVSLPVTLGLGREADIPVVAFDSGEPSWKQAPVELTLFYPGLVNWPRITAGSHAGAAAVAEGIPVRARHDEWQLTLYGLEAEAESGIRRGWILTLLSGLLLIAVFALALHRAISREAA